MLTNSHNCFCILNELQSQGLDVSDYVKEVVDKKIPKVVVKTLEERNDPVVMFYKRLNNKAHKIIKEILTCEGKPINTYIKIATSIITQSAITLEHDFERDVEGQNNFIQCLGLKNLSRGLYEYFTTGDYTLLVSSVNANKEDIKLILD